MSVALLAEIIRGDCAMTSVPLSLRIDMVRCFVMMELLIRKNTIQPVQKYSTSKLINVKQMIFVFYYKK